MAGIIKPNIDRVGLFYDSTMLVVFVVYAIH